MAIVLHSAICLRNGAVCLNTYPYTHTYIKRDSFHSLQSNQSALKLVKRLRRIKRKAVRLSAENPELLLPHSCHVRPPAPDLLPARGWKDQNKMKRKKKETAEDPSGGRSGPSLVCYPGTESPPASGAARCCGST